MKLNGKYRIQQIRNGEVIRTEKINNFVTTQGMNHMLDILFMTAESPLTVWFAGLISNVSTPTLSVADTGASHAGWTEFNDYDNDRKEIIMAAPASGSIETDTGSEAIFTISDTGTLYGVFICNEEDITVAPVKIFSEAAFSSTLPVVIGDTIKITYTLTLS